MLLSQGWRRMLESRNVNGTKISQDTCFGLLATEQEIKEKYLASN